jgi:hypothetical protein
MKDISMTDNRTLDPDLIEDDIRRTQDRIGDTIDRLEEQLSPPQLARSLVGDDGTEIAREALELTRQNPIPVALIAIGVIWLVATARTRNGSRLADLLAPRRAGRERQPMAPPSAGHDGRAASQSAASSSWRPIGSPAEPGRAGVSPVDSGAGTAASFRTDEAAIPL